MYYIHILYSIICIFHTFIHTSVVSQFGCFQILATVNSIAINRGVTIFFLKFNVFIVFRQLLRSGMSGWIL